jgi:hypothetical protein
MDHYRHALLKYRALKTFVRHLARTASQQTGDVAFHHGPAIATRTGQLDLMGCALTV